MGSKRSATVRDLETQPRPIAELTEGEGDGGPEPELQQWTFLLEEPTRNVTSLVIGTAVRAEGGSPRFRVFRSSDLLGFAPASVSGEMRRARARRGGVLHGSVVALRLEEREVVVSVELQGVD